MIGGGARAGIAAETTVTRSRTTMLKFLTAAGCPFESTTWKLVDE